MRSTINVKQVVQKYPQLWIIPLFLFVFGIVQVFSASRFKGVELKSNEYYFAIIHFFWVFLAIIMAGLAYIMKPDFLKKVSTVLYYGTVVALIAVFFAPEVNGAHRWFPLTGDIGIQPSEFAKITLILYGAYLIDKLGTKQFKTYIEHIKGFLLPVGLRIGFPLLLIILQPDLGTAVVIFVALFFMYILKQTKYMKQDLLLLGAVGIMGIIGFSLIESYRVERIQNYFHLITTGEVADEFGSGYQTRNILIGVGSGGLWGTGLGQSRQRFGYLAEVTAFTDSISAVIFEELGFVLSIIFIGVFVTYFLTIQQAAKEQKNSYNSLVLWGSLGLLMSQTFFHLSVNLAILPVKGIPLPFITYGGSSILAVGILTGIIIRFSRS